MLSVICLTICCLLCDAGYMNYDDILSYILLKILSKDYGIDICVGVYSILKCNIDINYKHILLFLIVKHTLFF